MVWRFIAGTLICTVSGAVPIEQIQPGDWVYSAHERTGEMALRPVMELYRNVVPEIWTVAYDHDHDHDPATPDATLDCTPGHPFWSEDAQAFISASDLSAGSRVRLITGESARVSAVHPRRGPPTGRGTTVYNFAVAEHHTYFAGDGGVWVHNLCSDALERYAGEMAALRKSGKSYDDAADELIAKAGNRDDLNTEEAQELTEYLFSKAGRTDVDTLLRASPDSYYSYTKLRSLISNANLSGWANGLEAHHMLEKKFAQILGLSQNDIIAVAVTPL
jgi:hypothetical protein